MIAHIFQYNSLKTAMNHCYYTQYYIIIIMDVDEC